MMNRWTMPLALLCAAACAPSPQGSADTEASPDAPLQSTIPEVRSAIDSAIGEAPASDVSECRLMALGVRPCGGPRMYRAYSIGETDSTYLAALADIYERLDRERNAELGLIGTCDVLAQPDLAFESGQCVTSPRR